jgi:hypothetical protein
MTISAYVSPVVNPGPNAPTVTMTSPASGTTVSGTVKLQASVSDSTSGVTYSTQFYVQPSGGSAAKVGSAQSGASPSMTWDSYNAEPATYDFYAVTTATDSGGSASTTSSSVSVTVAAAPPLIGYLASASGQLWVKEGPALTADWTEEQYSGVASFAVASDATNGPLIGYVTTGGAFYVKEGGLSAPWVEEQSSGVASIALASDGKNGPLLGFLTTSGEYWVMEGSLTGTWVEEQYSGVTAIALASDATNGPLIGYLNSAGEYWVKEGGLSADWDEEQYGAGVTSIALAPGSGD